jgi:hypothetical protein
VQSVRAGCSVGASGISVGASRISVGASGISVGASGISVGASGISIGASGISVGASGISVGASGISVGASTHRFRAIWIRCGLEITNQSRERWIQPPCQSPDWFVIVCGDVSFQLRGAKRIAQLIQGSPRDLEKPRELLVFASESFRDVPAHRVHRVFRLRVELEIACEALALRHLEHRDAYLIRELPDNQILVPFCSSHAVSTSTRRA